MKKIFFFIIITVFSVSAQQSFKKSGTAGFTFLEVPVSARSAALAENSIALSDMNAEAVFTNPAALGLMKPQHNIFVSYAGYIADIKHYAVSYAYNAGDIGTFGISVVQMDFGDITKTSVPLNTGQGLYQYLGTYSANSFAAGLSYSKVLTDKFSFGVTFKYVKETIDIFNASNLLFDGGILYYTGLSSLRIAATIQHFGVNSKFVNETFRMPSILKLGAAMEVLGDFNSDYRVTALVEALHPTDGDERINAGAEFCWKNILSLRGGYKFFTDEDTYSFGLGINPQLPLPMMLDFAYSDYGRLGNVLRFSFQLSL